MSYIKWGSFSSGFSLLAVRDLDWSSRSGFPEYNFLLVLKLIWATVIFFGVQGAACMGNSHLKHKENITVAQIISCNLDNQLNPQKI